MAEEPREPAIEVDAIRWERVQLIVEARVPAGSHGRPVAPGPRPGRRRRDRCRRPTPRSTAITSRRGSTCSSDPGCRRSGPAAGRSGPRSSRARRLPADRPATGFVHPLEWVLADGARRWTRRRGPSRSMSSSTRRSGARKAQYRRDHPASGAPPSGPSSRSRGLVARRGKPRVLFTSRLISEMSGNLQVVHERMVERGLDRDHDLTVMLKPGLTERWSFLDRLRLARALAGADVIVLDDSFPPLNWVTLSPKVRIIQLWHASGAFKTVGYSRVGPARPERAASTRKYTAAIVSSEFDVPFYAEAFGIPEARVIPTGIPRMDRFFDATAQRGRSRGGARRLSRDRRAADDPVRPDLPRRHDPRGVVRVRAARLRGAPRAGRRARRGRHHQDAPVRAGAGAHPGGVPRPPDRRLDPAGGRQRPAVRGRPPGHRLFVDRVRVLDPPPADAVLRLRPRGLRRRPATSTSRSSRSCRAGSSGRSRRCSTRSGTRTTRRPRSTISPPGTSRISTAARPTG